MQYPPVDLLYLRAITDCTGVIQHGVHSVPNRKLGYTTDDNARALIVAAQQYGRTRNRLDCDLAVKYLSFLHHAETSEHKFSNVMSYQREFLDEDGTDDCYGRAMWGCGFAASSELPENIRIVSQKLFKRGIVWAADLGSPRARAYSIIGMYEYLKSNEDNIDLLAKINALSDAQLALFKRYSGKDWLWYEPYLTYGNAILPLGMLIAGEVTGRKSYRNAARQTIDFLTETCVIDGRLEIIGNDGWYMRGGNRAWYDQQSIDAGYTVYLYATAYKLLGDQTYRELAELSYNWFFGHNRSGVSVYDHEGKGCFDGITPLGVNLNQGSESIICFLLAQLAMEEILAP